jgi:hypothetical protein
MDRINRMGVLFAPDLRWPLFGRSNRRETAGWTSVLQNLYGLARFQGLSKYLNSLRRKDELPFAGVKPIFRFCISPV